ncbi:hypothetical protein FRC08_016758 [Ceratobasidium sp. 394]|nr:hypothetical protein FRC08_016758 [Ceratobasidium sp. 394]
MKMAAERTTPPLPTPGVEPSSTPFPDPDPRDSVSIPDEDDFPMEESPVVATAALPAEALPQGALEPSEWAELLDALIMVHATRACTVCEDYARHVGEARRCGHLRELEYLGLAESSLRTELQGTARRAELLEAELNGMHAAVDMVLADARREARELSADLARVRSERRTMRERIRGLEAEAEEREEELKRLLLQRRRAFPQSDRAFARLPSRPVGGGAPSDSSVLESPATAPTPLPATTIPAPEPDTLPRSRFPGNLGVYMPSRHVQPPAAPEPSTRRPSSAGPEPGPATWTRQRPPTPPAPELELSQAEAELNGLRSMAAWNGTRSEEEDEYLAQCEEEAAEMKQQCDQRKASKRKGKRKAAPASTPDTPAPSPRLATAAPAVAPAVTPRATTEPVKGPVNTPTAAGPYHSYSAAARSFRPVAPMGPAPVQTAPAPTSSLAPRLGPARLPFLPRARTPPRPTTPGRWVLIRGEHWVNEDRPEHYSLWRLLSDRDIASLMSPERRWEVGPANEQQRVLIESARLLNPGSRSRLMGELIDYELLHQDGAVNAGNHPVMSANQLSPAIRRGARGEYNLLDLAVQRFMTVLRARTKGKPRLARLANTIRTVFSTPGRYEELVQSIDPHASADGTGDPVQHMHFGPETDWDPPAGGEVDEREAVVYLWGTLQMPRWLVRLVFEPYYGRLARHAAAMAAWREVREAPGASAPTQAWMRGLTDQAVRFSLARLTAVEYPVGPLRFLGAEGHMRWPVEVNITTDVSITTNSADVELDVSWMPEDVADRFLAAYHRRLVAQGMEDAPADAEMEDNPPGLS